MILDNETVLTTATGLDLESVRPGPGEPIKMFGTGLAADTLLVVTHGTSAALAEGGLTECVTVTSDADGQVEFELPSTTLQWIAAVFAQGTLAVTLAGNQTAK